jgi:hypothetical protein
MSIKIFSCIFLFNLSFGANFNAVKFFEEKAFTKEFYFFIKYLSYAYPKDKANEIKIPYTVDYVYETYTVEDQKYDLIFKKVYNKIYLDSVSFKNNELLIYYDKNDKKEKNEIETNFDEIKFTFLKKKCNNFFKSLSPYFEEDMKPSIIFNLPKIQLIGKSHYCLTCKQQNISQTNPSDLNHFLNKQHVGNLNGCEVYSKDEIQEKKFLEKLSDFSKFNTLKKELEQETKLKLIFTKN